MGDPGSMGPIKGNHIRRCDKHTIQGSYGPLTIGNNVNIRAKYLTTPNVLRGKINETIMKNVQKQFFKNNLVPKVLKIRSEMLSEKIWILSNSSPLSVVASILNSFRIPFLYIYALTQLLSN